MGRWGRWDNKPIERDTEMIPVMGPKEPEKRDYIRDYYGEWDAEEIKRQKRLHTLYIKRVMDNLRKALRIEVVQKEELTDGQRKRFIMTPLEFISRSFVKISLADLYRRYRHVRIQALTECIAIVGNGTTQEANMAAIREKIVEVGEAHKASKQNLQESKKNKCAAS